MWLVLCDSNDLPAIWAYHGLKARGLKPLELITSEMLSYGVRWDHRVGSEEVSIDITLSDGRSIDKDVRGVLNRLSYIPSEHLYLIQPDDRDYVNQELMAFYMSWLHALNGPVLNRPTPQGLSGRWRHDSEWIWLASKVGLPTPDYFQSSLDSHYEESFERRISQLDLPVNTIFVVEGHVVAESSPNHIGECCQRLAELAGTGLLGIEFRVGPVHPWTFAGATTFPDLRLGGDSLLDILASVMNRRIGG